MAGRSVAQKLLLKDGDVLHLSGATPELAARLRPLPAGVTDGAADAATVAVVVVVTRAELRARFGSDLPRLAGARAVWFVYPKGGRADLNRDTIIAESGAYGWRPISNVAVDDVWSAVRVRPLTDAESPVG